MIKRGDKVASQMVHVSFISRRDEEGWPDENGNLITQRFVYKNDERSIYITMSLKQARKLRDLLNYELKLNYGLKNENRFSRDTMEELSILSK